MSGSVVVHDATPGRGAHIPAGESTHAFSHKPAPGLTSEWGMDVT